MILLSLMVLVVFLIIGVRANTIIVSAEVRV
jgi:hypothetical protein